MTQVSDKAIWPSLYINISSWPFPSQLLSLADSQEPREMMCCLHCWDITLPWNVPVSPPWLCVHINNRARHWPLCGLSWEHLRVSTMDLLPPPPPFSRIQPAVSKHFFLAKENLRASSGFSTARNGDLGYFTGVIIFCPPWPSSPKPWNVRRPLSCPVWLSVEGKLLLAVEAGKGLRLRDLVYLSSWTPSLSIQLMEEEAFTAKVAPSPLWRQWAEKEQIFTEAWTPLGVVCKAVDRWGYRVIVRKRRITALEALRSWQPALFSSGGTEGLCWSDYGSKTLISTHPPNPRTTVNNLVCAFPDL